MEIIKQKYLSGERALFKSNNLKIEDSIFADGESPLKESKDIEINETIFKWKYPLWYCNDVKVTNSTLLETARSGIWYTKNISIIDSIIEAPKTFRRAQNIYLENVDLPIAQETLWNCENVTVYDSTIIGEYLGWNSKNITFINCTIESLQGLCYIENLKLINCKLINTTLAFEYSTVEVEVNSHIDSVVNPISGVIKAHSIGELILDKTKINPSETKIVITNPPIKSQTNIECICC